jgi:ERCC4-type nuclease
MYPVKPRYSEEWPSEKWNYQDKLSLKPLRSLKKDSDIEVPAPTQDESNESFKDEAKITKDELSDFLTSIEGIGKKKVKKIVKHFGDVEEVIGVLHQNPSMLTEIKGITDKLAKKVKKAWQELLK